MPTYYEINEALCRRAHEQNHLITDYAPGSTTASYQAAVDAFAAKCEAAKQGCRPGHAEKLDALSDRYARRLAAWYNDHAANDARHVSWFVAGPSNYDLRAHDKWSRREDALREEWQAIQAMESQISKAAGDPSVILSSDPEAIAHLRAKLEDLEAAHTAMKEANAYYRKRKTLDGCPGVPQAEREWLTRPGVFAKGDGSPLALYGCPYPSYALQNSNANIKRTRQRLQSLQAAKAIAEPVELAGPGYTYRENTEAMRVQFLFPGKPGEATRALLKSNGFRWAPSQGAWQRQLTPAGRAAAARVQAVLCGTPK